jgi:hypothetical protein
LRTGLNQQETTECKEQRNQGFHGGPSRIRQRDYSFSGMPGANQPWMAAGAAATLTVLSHGRQTALRSIVGSRDQGVRNAYTFPSGRCAGSRTQRPHDNVRRN